MHLVANKESQMRQMELDLGPDEEAKRAAVQLDRPTHDEVMALVAEAIVALIGSAREKEPDGEPSIQP
jgi:hypothetical protein